MACYCYWSTRWPHKKRRSPVIKRLCSLMNIRGKRIISIFMPPKMKLNSNATRRSTLLLSLAAFFGGVIALYVVKRVRIHFVGGGIRVGRKPVHDGLLINDWLLIGGADDHEGNDDDDDEQVFQRIFMRGGSDNVNLTLLASGADPYSSSVEHDLDKRNASQSPTFSPATWVNDHKTSVPSLGRSSTATVTPTVASDWYSIHWRESSHTTRIPVPNAGIWALDTTGKWRYNDTSNPAPNERRTHQGFLKCLSNKHILITGDSRARYQYLSLVLFLAHGRFPQCSEWESPHVDESTTMCKLSDESGWDSWKSFYKGTNQAANTRDTDELCFCYRHPNWIAYGRTRTRENRFFTMRTPYGKIKLTFIQIYQNFCTLESGFPPFSRGQHTSCGVGLCSTMENPSLLLQERHVSGAVNCVNALVDGFANGSKRKQKSPITHVFAHSGWLDENIGCELMEFSYRTKIPAWVLGPPFRAGTNPVVPEHVTHHSCGVPYFDRSTMTVGLRRLYKDALHVKTSVNEEFNHKLMDVLCKGD